MHASPQTYIGTYYLYKKHTYIQKHNYIQKTYELGCIRYNIKALNFKDTKNIVIYKKHTYIQKRAYIQTYSNGTCYI